MASAMGESKKPKTAQNLVVRGTMYYFRKKMKGKQYLISTGIRVGGRPEFERASRRATELERDAYDGKRGWKEEDKKETTVGAWCAKYVAAQKSSVAPATFANLVNVTRHLTETEVNGETWADRDLRTLTETDCRALMTALQFKALKSQNSRRTFHSIAGSIFKRAVSEHFCDVNPWNFKKVASKPRERVISVAEQKAVWPFLAPYYQRVMTLEVLAGLRVACELHRLKEADVDFVRRQVNVRQGKGSKQRYVPLASEAATAIREQLVLNAAGTPGCEKLSPAMRQRIEDGYIFPVSFRMVLRAWHLAAETAGIERFTSHDLRRTFGTRCAEANVPMKKLQVWMGHSDISITAKFYVHLNNEGDGGLLERMTATFKEGTAAEGVAEGVAVLPFSVKS